MCWFAAWVTLDGEKPLRFISTTTTSTRGAGEADPDVG
jgi:hypothetical protein